MNIRKFNTAMSVKGNVLFSMLYNIQQLEPVKNGIVSKGEWGIWDR